MPWLIGIDEAGYGPNLGPLVQTSVPLFVPNEEETIWKALAKVVRRSDDANDERLHIDDSKKVNVGIHGFARLERGVLAALADDVILPFSLGDLLRTYALGDSRAELLREPWFDVTLELPVEAKLESIMSAGKALHRMFAVNDFQLEAIRGIVTPAPRFNDLLAKLKNKSNVLAAGVIELLRANRTLPGDEPLVYLIDKLGGRNYYAAMIQEAFPDGWVSAEREGSEICSYRILGVDRDIRIVVQPRADGTHFTVALASMASKYLREVFMRQFNRWWHEQVPGIKPTAGYPQDAARFIEEIHAKVKKLGFEMDAIWRRK
ncbi:MAG: hypothetical protein K8T89_10730 [Planctomycetes bacterium]|nr:hypothetical protein [Planctomycetota bacterium]